MFHRKRATSNPPNRHSTSSINSSALAAASQAFQKDRASHASLSNAAAAAALRAHPTAPTTVGDLQTKRMVRRASQSSNASSPVGRVSSPAGSTLLRRQNSSGSMAERTFRAASPVRVSPSQDLSRDTPPVPAIPKDLATQQHRRAVSYQPPRSIRVPTPETRDQSTTASSPNGGLASSMHSPTQSRRGQSQEIDRRSTVNFSYPISPQASPRVSPIQHKGQSGWFSGPLTTEAQPRSELPPLLPKAPNVSNANELATAAHRLREVAEQPVARETKASLPPQGTRLSLGGMQAKPRGTAVQEQNPATPERQHSPVQAPVVSASYSKSPEPARDSPVPVPAVPAVPETFVQRAPPTQSTPPRQSSPDQSVGAKPSQKMDTPQYQPPREHTPPKTPTPNISPPQSPPPEVSREKTASVSERKADQPTLSVPQDVPGTPRDNPTDPERSEKHPQPSPARSAHFAPVAIELPNGVRHNPPPRSVSPAKSALKHSPSTTVRNRSPSALLSNGPSRLSISEASDTMSDDGKPSKKKKQARVSFEEPAVAPDNSKSPSPDLSATNSTAGLTASRWSNQATGENELEEVMKPRPVLPSFGSIRGRRSRDEATAEKVTETVPSSTTASASTIGEPLEVSSDHALGQIISQHASKKHEAKLEAKPARDKETDKVSRDEFDPVPPEVTSVEGSGYYSDSESSAQFDDVAPAMGTPRPPTPPLSSNDATPEKAVDAPETEIVVPSIAVQPATPAAVEESDDVFTVPGGFPDEQERLSAMLAEEPNAQKVILEDRQTARPLESTGRSLSQAEKNALVDMAFNQARLSIVDEESSDAASSDSDNSSIYSDAPEEISDEDEFGFASIDALVQKATESEVATNIPAKTPPVKAQPQRLDTSPPKSSPAQSTEIPPAPLTDDSEDWEKVKNYWNELSEKRKQQLIAEFAKQEALKKAQETPATPSEPPKPAKVTPAAKSKPTQSITPNQTTSVLTEQPAEARKTALKQTMRSQPAGRPVPEGRTSQSAREQPLTLRTTMRGPGLAASKHSEQADQRASLQKRNIPQSQAPSSVVPRPKTAPGLTASMHNPSNISRIGAPLGKAPMPKDDDSDASESSFKKSRRPTSKAGMGERYSMRTTMRGASGTGMQSHSLRPSSPPANGRGPQKLGMRSLSPTGSLMRKSMRTGSVEPRPSSNRSFLSGMGKEKPKNSKSGTASKFTPKFVSRFADSSDDEDYSRPRFQSRFADSEDEDDITPLPVPKSMPAGLTPVRGIPRKPGAEDGDSTDLEDEDTEEEELAARRSAKAVEKELGSTAMPNKITNGASPGGTLAKGGLKASKHAPALAEMSETAAGSMPEKEKGKRRFFGLGKRRVSSGPGVLAPLQRPSTPPASQEKEKEFGTAPTSSPTSTRHGSPKLQRRGKPGRVMSDSWPLPESGDAKESQLERRNSHEAAGTETGKPSRPKLRGRMTSNDTVTSNGTNGTNGTKGTDGSGSVGNYVDEKGRVISARTGKKKKFPMLRKVFRLDD